MDHDILRKIMEVFSQENTRLKGEITELRKQLNSASAKNDDKIIAEVFAEKKTKKEKKVKVPQAVESHPVESQPEVVPEMPKKGRPRTITDKSAYQRAYQAEYRAKKKAEKNASQSVGDIVHSA